MNRATLLGRGWSECLRKMIRGARTELLITSPFITQPGADFICSNLSGTVRRRGTINILTDLSPVNIVQGATDPEALRSIESEIAEPFFHHLPRLHAKVYVADIRNAIITSGNLTMGGLHLNYEYGVEVSHERTVQLIHKDVIRYSTLGAAITTEHLSKYCQVAERLRKANKRKEADARKSAREQFDAALQVAEDELLRARLAGGAVHTVFARTIAYLLESHGPLRTKEMHTLIEAIHPALCDNNVDRIIDGKRFGKKWKHAVRTAQQQLKKRGIIKLASGRWIAQRRDLDGEIL